ncbi:MAG: mannose-1-phosphate guanylyltransferase [Bacteroidia bacterium]
MRQHDYVIIMAGGIGSRFWPMSRTSLPKQFHDILGMGKTMIQMTYERFHRFIPQENIFIVTNERYLDLVRTQLPGIRDSEILLEPVGRNTAPCIAYAAFKIQKRDPAACILVVGSDYLIRNTANFLKDAAVALDESRKQPIIMTLGIRPTRPDTGYGYLQYIEGDKPTSFYKVKMFTEKPDLEMAKTFIRSGDFLWNSGMFVFNVQTILDSFAKLMPDLFETFNAIQPALDSAEESSAVRGAYERSKNESIDLGVMEKAPNVYVIPSSFDWSDVGTWASVYEQMEQDYMGNAVKGQVMAFDSANNLVQVSDPKKLVVLHGINDMIVVDTGDVLLICRMDHEQQIRHVVSEVKKSQGNTLT